SAQPAAHLRPLHAPELLPVALARAEGVLESEADQIRAGDLPAAWENGRGQALLSLWSAWTATEGWEPARGPDEGGAGASPAAVSTLALAALAGVPDGSWVDVADVDGWLAVVPD